MYLALCPCLAWERPILGAVRYAIVLLIQASQVNIYLLLSSQFLAWLCGLAYLFKWIYNAIDAGLKLLAR